MNSERLAGHELCPRKQTWSERYVGFRVSLMHALYRALEAGLTSELDPEKAASNEFLALAAKPGLDIEGPDVYNIAMHNARLAGIVSVALRSGGSAWKRIPPTGFWESACYDSGDGNPRRVVLVDHWGASRQTVEATSWRTIGELVSLERPILLTAVEIGTTRQRKRISPWTRAWRHPRNKVCRFRKRDGEESFGGDWEPVWREDCELKTKDWLDLMEKDGCMDAIQTSRIALPQRPERYLAEMKRLSGEMGSEAMRLAGCNDRMSGACPFIQVCHGAKEADPLRYGFKLRGTAELNRRDTAPEVAFSTKP